MEELVANPATTVVDVRETGEFAGGHFAGAINIPLGIIPLYNLYASTCANMRLFPLHAIAP